MALRGHAGAAAGIHIDGHLRQSGFQQQGVGDDTDVGAQPNQRDGGHRLLIGVVSSDDVGQAGAAEGGLVDGLLGQQVSNLRTDLPAVSAPDAVGDREKFSLLGVQVVVLMGVPGGQHPAGKALDPVSDLGHNGLCLFGAKSTVDKIILHINDNQKIHGNLLCGKM